MKKGNCGELLTNIFIDISKIYNVLKLVNRIQNKSFCLHNIYVCCVYLLCIYNTHTHAFIYLNMLCLYSKYIYV